MALMQSEDDDRVRRAEQSSEESMKTARKSRQSAKQAYSGWPLEKVRGDQHMVLDNSNIFV